MFFAFDIWVILTPQRRVYNYGCGDAMPSKNMWDTWLAKYLSIQNPLVMCLSSNSPLHTLILSYTKHLHELLINIRHLLLKHM